jgi:uncharacterized protein YbjT (DUF2867 family)
MMHETILVTGATGTVGREVIKQLSLVDGVRVRAGVHSVIKGENLKRLPDVELVEIEFTDPESLHAAFTHVDKVFLITPFTDNQVEMAKTLIDEAKKAGVKHIVKLSALGADQETGLLLGRWHREIEEYIAQSGIPFTFLRPSSFMQNLVNYNSKTIKEANTFYLSTGNGKVGYIDSRDIASVGVELLTGHGHEGMAYDLTGPEALSADELAAIISEVTGKPVNYTDVPEESTREAMKTENVPGWMIDAMLELHHSYKSGKGDYITNTVEELIGRKPHTFRQFVQDYKECFI